MRKFEDAFFNVYEENGEVYIESTCVNISILADSWNLGGYEKDEDVCRVKVEWKPRDVIERLKSAGIPENRIALNGEPLDVEVESSLRGRRVLICPVCGSSQIVIANVAGLLPPLYRCLKCGYIGRIVLVAEPTGEEGSS